MKPLFKELIRVFIGMVIGIVLTILMAILLSSCTIHHYERKSIKTQNRQLSEQVEAYYYTIS